MQIDSLRLSESSRGLLRSCPRKLEFRKFYMHSRRDESLPAGAGIALHAAYQNWLIHHDFEQACWVLLLHFPFKFEHNPMKDRSIQACYSTLKAMTEFSQYGQYELAYINVDGENRPGVEVPFQINIDNFSLDDSRAVPVTYVGFIDVVFYDIITGDFVVLDIKTHRNNMDDMTAVYKFQDQCLPYAMVLERALNHPINMLDVRYMSCYIDVLAPQIRDYSFIKSKADITDWTKGLALDLQLIKLYYQTHWFPRNGNACSSFFRPCSHFDYCASRDERTVEHMLSFEELGKENPIDPWIVLDLEIAS